MTFNFAKKVSQAFGYLTAREVDAMKVVAGYAGDDNVEKGLRPAVFVNVGAGSGTSGLALCEANPGAMIYTVDRSPGGPLGGLQNELNAFEGTGFVCPTQILGDSAQTGRNWQGGPLDLVFIDAGHLRDEINADILAWLPHIRKNGYICFHDYGSPNWPDVKAIVDEYFQDRKPIIYVDTFIAFRVYGNELKKHAKGK